MSCADNNRKKYLLLTIAVHAQTAMEGKVTHYLRTEVHPCTGGVSWNVFKLLTIIGERHPKVDWISCENEAKKL